jgi:serine/threonine protein kinase
MLHDARRRGIRRESVPPRSDKPRVIPFRRARHQAPKKQQQVVKKKLSEHPRIIKAADDVTYFLGKRLGTGSFGSVYEVQRPSFVNHRPACMKLEQVVPGRQSLLQMEQQSYAEIARSQRASPYFPAVGDLMLSADGQWRFLVIEKGGKDMLSMMPHLNRRQKLIALRQCMTALMMLHEECGFLHRDLKPENILMREENRGIMLIDMGFVKRFRTGPDRRHIPNVKHKRTLHGTLNYASIPTLMIQESSRRDDIEALVYTFVVILHEHDLPWTDLTYEFAKIPAEKFNLFKAAAQVAEIKRASSPLDVVGPNCHCLRKILESVRCLGFDERPPYEEYVCWIQEEIRRVR